MVPPRKKNQAYASHCLQVLASPMVVRAKDVKPCPSNKLLRPAGMNTLRQETGWGWGLTLGNAEVESAHSKPEHPQYIQSTKVCLYVVDNRVSRVFRFLIRARAV